jgi:hypothetical protein
LEANKRDQSSTKNGMMAPAIIQTKVEEEHVTEQSQAKNELAEDGVEDKSRAQDSAADANQTEATEGSVPTNGAPKEATEDQKLKADDLALNMASQPTNWATKDEIEDQKPKAEDLALNVAASRQRRRPRHQRGNRNEAVARKVARFGIKNKIIGKSQAKNDHAVPTTDKKAFRATTSMAAHRTIWKTPNKHLCLPRELLCGFMTMNQMKN